MTISKWAARKRAQKAVRAVMCQDCGATENLERHHPDYQRPLDVLILCVRCHRKHDQQDGFAPKVAPAICLICGTEFQPRRTRRARLCGNPACLVECGRRAAQKRWSIPSGPTDCDFLETESSHNRPQPPSNSLQDTSLETRHD
jgi:hypothetical protein